MGRKRSKNRGGPLKQLNEQDGSRDLDKIDVKDEVDTKKVGRQPSKPDEIAQPSINASDTVEKLTTNTAALYHELDSFRQRWKRELHASKTTTTDSDIEDRIQELKIGCHSRDVDKENAGPSKLEAPKLTSYIEDNYAEAKKLFLIAVKMEQDDMHFESVRYYRQSIRLCPDVEKRIFREQCGASTREADKTVQDPCSESYKKLFCGDSSDSSSLEQIPALVSIGKNFHDSIKESGGDYAICRVWQESKRGSHHISDLPDEIILDIFRYVIGSELDLASLESLGLVCRGFFMMSRSQRLWMGICQSTWGIGPIEKLSREADDNVAEVRPLDWRQIFLNKHRVNFDGLYISRTRYIRQGDVGFQDIVYRPFHVVRYYRYLRFFPNGRVLILTTNEEPDRIVPIFRHATRAKHFSPELSILEGTYEYEEPSLISIVADKDCLAASVNLVSNQRRQAQLYWSRQTPLSQRFSTRFEIKTAENKAHRHNILKWLSYTILTRYEAAQEITNFDLSSDTFPNLIYHRVKKFAPRIASPLISS